MSGMLFFPLYSGRTKHYEEAKILSIAVNESIVGFGLELSLGPCLKTSCNPVGEHSTLVANPWIISVLCWSIIPLCVILFYFCSNLSYTF